MASVCSLLSLIGLKIEEEKVIILGNWISSGSLDLNWAIQLNLLTGSMVLMVNFVSTLKSIILYASKIPFFELKF